MPKYIGSHDDVIRTKTGHVVVFKVGEESWVPDNPEVIKAVRQAGHQPVQEQKTVVEQKNKVEGTKKPIE